MSTYTAFSSVALAAGTFLVTACAAEPQPSTLMAPTTVQTSAVTAPLVVEVDKICAGRETDIRVFVDLLPIGVTNPGEPGVSRMVAVGQHALSAVSARGTEWGPYPTTVVAGGRVERLGCLPPDAL